MLWLSGPENFSGPSRNGPQVTKHATVKCTIALFLVRLFAFLSVGMESFACASASACVASDQLSDQHHRSAAAQAAETFLQLFLSLVKVGFWSGESWT